MPTTTLLNGKKLSQTILQELKEKIQYDPLSVRPPSLHVILVGNDPASKIYVNKKVETCKSIGINSKAHYLNSNIEEDELLELINSLNEDKNVDGILVQLPLPTKLDEKKILFSISPKKDVDGLHPTNLGKLCHLSPDNEDDILIPCTALGCLEILKRNNISTQGKNVVIVGRSEIVGRPLSILLSSKPYNATVTLAHSKTDNIPKLTKKADITILAVGKANFLGENDFHENSVIIDVGINRLEINGKRKIVGDIDYNKLLGKVKAITPVPGGVGPMTIAMLLTNTIKASFSKIVKI